MDTLKNEKVKNAVMIGTLCSLTYLGVYFARNILGAVSPQMIERGIFTTEYIGSLSSLFFICYAIGQLINGAIGERVKAVYMISCGLIFAGVCCYLFTVLYEVDIAVKAVYGLAGFSLSMVYAPMVKTVAENTEPAHATRCSLGFTFSSFLGSPIAGVAAGFFLWDIAFRTCSAVLLIMGALVFTVFFLFERRGVIKYGGYTAKAKNKQGFAILIKHRIIKFTFISIITGVVRTTVVFWMPTYISQYLGFSSAKSAKIFTVASFVISMTAFIAVFIYEKVMKSNMDMMLFASFASAVIWFGMVFITKNPLLNIIFLIIAIMSSNSAGSMLWSRYCPSLRDTGMVSTATGYLDFMSYTAASISSTMFANAVSVIGWHNLILTWMALMLAGALICIPFKQIKSK